MDIIKGFKHVDYTDLQKELDINFKRSGKSYAELAVAADLISTATIKNAFDFDEQKVSDKTLTRILDFVGMEAMIVWFNGRRYYYISKKVPA